jgi:CHAT domain-containing protein
MERFYKGIVDEGLTKAEALRQAQETLALSEEFSDPTYWAGFVLIGDPH